MSTAATCSPTRHHHQTTTGSWRWRALSPYATAASRRQPRVACVTVQAPLTACSLRHDLNPFSVCFLRESPCFACCLPEYEHCSGKKIAVNVFDAARLRRPLSNDVPDEHLVFFLFFVHFRNSLLLKLTTLNDTRYETLHKAADRRGLKKQTSPQIRC